MTVEQIAEKLGVSHKDAYGFVKFLQSKGVLSVTGSAPRPPGQRGKGASVYSVSSNVETALSEIVRSLLG